MATSKEKNKGGRPSKLPTFVEAMERVFQKNKGDIFIFTDDDLLFMINESLPEKDRIAERTFALYKADAQEGNFKSLPLDFIKFLHLYKKALSEEKKNLMQNLRTEKDGWQRWAWILERKFSEWNLKHISEVDQKTSVKGEVTIIKLPHNGRD